MSTVRVVRPRPLALTDRIPVFWPGVEPSQELKQIDSGALYRHLVAASTPAANRKRKRTEKYHAPKEGEAHEHFSPLRKTQEQQAEGAGPIAVPAVRSVQDYRLNQQAALQHGPMIDGDISAAPYLRHQQLLPGAYEEHQPTEYNVDDEDLAWLNSINTKNGQGLFAAAVGLYRQMSQRISGGADCSTPHAQESRLSVDDFERAIDALELAHFAAVKAWWEEQQTGPSTSTPQLPKIPAMKTLLPRAAALDVVAASVADRKLAAQLLDHWVRKRQAEGGPLLPHLWFEQPWKLVAFAGCINRDDEDFDEHLPFMAVEPRSAHKQRRTAPNRRRINEEDALEALVNLRSELEMLRTLADQVRKREKLKRQLLLLSQQELQMRQELGVPPAAPVPKTARLHQLARNYTGAGLLAAVPSAKAAAAAAAHATSSAAAVRGNSKQLAASGSSAHLERLSARRQPGPDLTTSMAAAADAAAAASSPHEGERLRQTRTSAAAAAAAFELAFAAKRAKAAAVVGPVPRASRLGHLPASAAANDATCQQAQKLQKQKVSSPQPCSRATVVGSSKASISVAVKGARHDRSRSRQQQVAAAAGDADDEMDEQAQGAAGGGNCHKHNAVASAKPPRRCRRQLTVQSPNSQQQQQVSGQQGQQTQQQGMQRQRRQQWGSTVAATAGTVAKENILSSSSSESDDSDDVDYIVSQEEGVRYRQHHHPPEEQQQMGTWHHGPSRTARAKGRSAAAAAAAAEALYQPCMSESDDDFQESSRRTVALKGTQKQQQLTAAMRHRGLAAASTKGNVTAAAIASPGASEGQQQGGAPRVTCKQRMHLRAKHNGFVGNTAPTTAAVAAFNGAASICRTHRQDSGTAEPPRKQPRLQRGCRAALLPAAMPSIHAARELLADAAGCRTAATGDWRVLRLHNQQQGAQPQENHRGKQLAVQQKRLTAGAGAGSTQCGSASQPVTTTPMPAKRGSHTARPAAGDSRGASVRRPAIAAADVEVRHAQGRAAVGRRELRSLGLQCGFDKKQARAASINR